MNRNRLNKHFQFLPSAEYNLLYQVKPWTRQIRVFECALTQPGGQCHLMFYFDKDKKSSFPIVSTRSDFVLNPPPTHQHPKKPFMTIESDQRSRQLDKHSKPFLAHKYCNEMGPTDYFDRAVKLHSICKPRYRGKNKSIQRTVLRYFEFGFENCYIHFNQLNQDSQLSRVDFRYHLAYTFMSWLPEKNIASKKVVTNSSKQKCNDRDCTLRTVHSFDLCAIKLCKKHMYNVCTMCAHQI